MPTRLLILIFALLSPLAGFAQSDGTINYSTATNRLEAYLGVLGYQPIGVSNVVGSCLSTEVGTFTYDTGLNTYKFCNGSNWISFSYATTSATCSVAGTLQYNGDYSLQFCNGTNWVRTSNLQHGYFVLTSASTNANLGGLSGANATCLSNLSAQVWLGKADAQARGLLNSTNVKAFLCDSTTCNNANASTVYRFARSGSSTAGGASFTTDAGGLGPNNSGRWSNATYFNSVTQYWSNRNDLPSNTTTWAGTPAGSGASGACTDWSSSSSGQSGNFGSSDFTTNNRWFTTGQGCNVSLRLVCFVHP